MRIAIAGPRSIGKTTTALLLAEQLKYVYVSGDDISDDILSPYGGLYQILKDNRDDLLMKAIVPTVERGLKKDNVVLDVPPGTLYERWGQHSEKARTIVKKKATVIIGLLPSMSDEQSINVLFARERQRPQLHYLSDEELKIKVKRNYREVKAMLKRMTKNIIYTSQLTPQRVVERCKSFL